MLIPGLFRGQLDQPKRSLRIFNDKSAIELIRQNPCRNIVCVGITQYPASPGLKEVGS